MEEEIKKIMKERKLTFSHHLRVAIIQKTITIQKLTPSNDLSTKGLNLNYEQQGAVRPEYRGRRYGGVSSLLGLGFVVKNQN
jgi:hypothetical protein